MTLAASVYVFGGRAGSEVQIWKSGMQLCGGQCKPGAHIWLELPCQVRG